MNVEERADPIKYLVTCRVVIEFGVRLLWPRQTALSKAVTDHFNVKFNFKKTKKKQAKSCSNCLLLLFTTYTQISKLQHNSSSWLPGCIHENWSEELRVIAGAAKGKHQYFGNNFLFLNFRFVSF